jgi:hypothetical protein
MRVGVRLRSKAISEGLLLTRKQTFKLSKTEYQERLLTATRRRFSRLQPNPEANILAAIFGSVVAFFGPAGCLTDLCFVQSMTTSSGRC